MTRTPLRSLRSGDDLLRLERLKSLRPRPQPQLRPSTLASASTRSASEKKLQSCPNCGQEFIRLSRHLPHCRLQPSPHLEVVPECVDIPDIPSGLPSELSPPPPSRPDQHHSDFGRDDELGFVLHDFTHSRDVQVPSVLTDIQPRLPVKWPHTSNLQAWSSFQDAVLHRCSPAVYHLPVDQAMDLLSHSIYDCGSSVFGVRRAKARRPVFTPNSRTVERHCRREKDKAKRRLRAEPLSSQAKYDYLQAVRRHSQALHVLLGEERNLDEQAARSKFKRDPHQFANHLFSPPQLGKPTFTKEVADEFYTNTYRDTDRSFRYSPPDGFPRPPPPAVPSSASFATLKEFRALLRRKSNRSAAGVNGVSYMVYKRCSRLCRILWQILGKIWSRRRIPLSFRIARTRQIPKTRDFSPLLDASHLRS